MIDGDMGATPTAAPRREPLRRDPRAPARRGVSAAASGATCASTRSSSASSSWRRPRRAASGSCSTGSPGCSCPPTTAHPTAGGRVDAPPAPRPRRDRGRRRHGPRDPGLPAHDARAGDLVLRRHRLAGGAAGRGRCAAVASVAATHSGRRARTPPAPEEERRERTQVLSRNGVGAALVIAAGLVFLSADRLADRGARRHPRRASSSLRCSGSSSRRGSCGWCARWPPSARSASARRSAPRWPRTCTTRSCRRSRSIQKRADDPRAVAALARRQERELRAWLAAGREGDRRPPRRRARGGGRARSRTRTACTVDVVVVGDAALDERGEALVAAAREAIVNAAKFAADAGPVASTPRRADDALEVFVRDRGPGFDPAAVPEDRRGVRESIVGRMERHGGRADDPLGARRRDRGRADDRRGRR